MAAVDETVGRSVEDAAEDPEAPENGQMPIPGTGSQLTLEAGGELPESSTVKLRGGSLPLEGQFNKGDTVRVWVEVQISEVHFVDKIDQHGNVNGTERRHLGRMRRVQRQ